MTPLAALEAGGDPERAAEAADYHKADRRYLGTPAAEIDALVAQWRAEMDIEERTALAAELWDTNVHEARLAAAKLLLQARMRPDDAAWDLVQAWLPQLDAWSLADAVSKSAEKRVMADLTRMEVAEIWIGAENPWMRRAALIAAQPLAKRNHPKAGEAEAREQAIGWLEALLPDRDWHVQKAISAWLRDLAKHDADRARLFLAEHADAMRGFTRKEAGQTL